jgi:hypothetical protein
MPEFLSDGSVVLSRVEMQQLNGFVNRVEAMFQKYQELKHQHKKLIGIHEYAILCRDAFEAENIKLREQLLADQYAQIFRIEEQTSLCNRELN